MSHLSLVSASPTGRVDPSACRIADAALISTRPARRAGDVAEISVGALEAARAETPPSPIRAELVSRIRADIASGTYLTDDKLQAAVDRLSRDLDLSA